MATNCTLKDNMPEDIEVGGTVVLHLIKEFQDCFDAAKNNEDNIHTLISFLNGFEDRQKAAILFEFINQMLCFPGRNERQTLYEKNTQILKLYPYIFGKDIPRFERLQWDILRVNKSWLLLINREKQMVKALEYDSSRENRYFFNELDKPLFVKNETNQKNLKFLRDTVRLSEDFAGDNHIYLYYEQVDDFFSTLQYIDWSRFLDEKQFVFLVGPATAKNYPLDFQTKYGINYSKMVPKPLQLKEINRLCFFANRPFSGTAVTLSPLSANSYVEYAFENDFHRYSVVYNESITKSAVFAAALLRRKNTYTLAQIKAFLHEPENVIYLNDLEQLLSEVEGEITDDQPLSSVEIFKLIFLLRFKRKKLNQRVVPLIVLDIHLLNFAKAYTGIIQEFKYLTILTCMRDPVRAFISGYERGVLGEEHMFKHLLASEYSYMNMINAEFYDCYFSFRFEDIKLYPLEAVKSMCRLLNLPYQVEMLQADWVMEDAHGVVIRKSDFTPLCRNISHLFNDYDLMRFQLLHHEINEHYGYRNCWEEIVVDDETLKAFWEKHPFLFEEKYTEYYGNRYNAPKNQKLRDWINETVNTVLNIKLKGKLRMPHVIVVKPLIEEG
ncbi:MAG: hypothetical protein KIC77_08370 [Clostridiales bacterium]|nr:hypothetical protein [Clostridiales bacterium]